MLSAARGQGGSGLDLSLWWQSGGLAAGETLEQTWLCFSFFESPSAGLRVYIRRKSWLAGLGSEDSCFVLPFLPLAELSL